MVPGNLPYMKRYLLIWISEIFRTARGGREYFLPIFLLILLFTLPKVNFQVSLSTLYLLLIFSIMGGKRPTVSKEPSTHPKCYTTHGAARRRVPLSPSHSQAVVDPCVGISPCMQTAASHELRESGQADTPGRSQLPGTALLKSCRHHLK